MDQQQLQIARAALWHRTAAGMPSAPMLTLEEAARWLDDIGFCLFLPRHAQLPAPAPSFVEACMGAASAAPAPGAIAQAMDLVVRLVDERRAVPLNLLGTHSEQPDFLITPDVLPWVAAIRGDRQWKTAPGGRTAPIVIRTFEVLDREGELTAIELREILGHEITEAAALRALMELWTGLRAMPVYAEGAPARWTLLKNRFAAQMATGANTAQTTALSAVLSLYLRSAVAATTEEAEIFLSPLTARSRIREVLHGMMATRQLGTTTVATQTLLFVEGSLPETAATETKPEAGPEAGPPVSGPRPATPAVRPPFRKGPRPARWERPEREGRPRADERRPGQNRPGQKKVWQGRPGQGAAGPKKAWQKTGPPKPWQKKTGPPKPWQKKPATPHSGGFGQDRPEARAPEGKRPRFDRGSGERPGGPARKPWQKRDQSSFRKKAIGQRPFVPREGAAAAGEKGHEDRPARKPEWRGRERGAAPFRKDRKDGERRPWKERRPDRSGPRADRPSRDERSSEARGERPPRPFRPGKPFGANPGGDRRSRGEGSPAGEARPFRPGKRFDGKPGFGRKTSAEGGAARESRPFRPGKSFAGKPRWTDARRSQPGRPVTPENKFRKPAPGKQKPRKNRSQKETPE